MGIPASKSFGLASMLFLSCMLIATSFDSVGQVKLLRGEWFAERPPKIPLLKEGNDL
jgi:hypothetical protein